MNTAWRKETIPDIVNLVLGAVLFLSPWMFGYADSAASWNSWLSGLLIAVLAVAALAAFAEWEEWVNLLAGLWVAASPWLVNFSANPTATRLHLIAGIVVAAVAAVRIWLARHHGVHA